MNDSQFNIERATNGLVLALFLAAAIFLVIMLVQVLNDIDTRRGETSSASPTSAVVVQDDRPRVLS
jgi:hypothetical protein